MHSPKNDWSILNEGEVTPWQNDWLGAAEKEENTSHAYAPSQSVFTRTKAVQLQQEALVPESLVFRAEDRAPEEGETTFLPVAEAGLTGHDHSHALDTAEAEAPYLEHLLPADISPAFPKLRVAPASSPGLLSPEKNNHATRLNQKQVPKSGLSLADITAALNRHIDLAAIRQTLAGHNRHQPGKPYQFLTGDIDAVFTEAVHQFQVATYLNPAEHDGILGASTLETLGFFRHQLKPAFNRNVWYGQQQLNQIKQEVSDATNGEFTAANWFDFLGKPAWLGIKITDGIQVLLLEKLRQAESWLLARPAYTGLTPAALGKALGFTKTMTYSGARLSANKEAMHGFGLALDINATGNPWVGAGWIRYDVEKLKERTRLLDVLRKASAEKLPGDTIFAYLHSIAQAVGTDTAAAYQVLKSRNDEFVDYLQNNPAELQYWRNSATFHNRNPLNGFLNLPADLVYALRQIAGLAWGAIDFGPRASGDIMHFDLRTSGVGKIIAGKIKAYIPQSGHPSLQAVLAENTSGELESHEAIEEATWGDTEEEEALLAADQDLESQI